MARGTWIPSFRVSPAVGLLLLVVGCRHGSEHSGPKPGAPGPREVPLPFHKGQRFVYRGRLLFSARQDAFVTGAARKYVFESTFRLTRSVESVSGGLVCFRDRFGGSQVHVGDVSPVLERRIASELDGLVVSWCLGPRGRLARFEVVQSSETLRGLNLAKVLKRLYALAAGASWPGKPAGDKWRLFHNAEARQGSSVLRLEAVTTYRARAGASCRPEVHLTAWRERPRTDSGRRRSSSSVASRGHCFVVSGLERGIIPDFQVTTGGRRFSVGGVVKGRLTVLFDREGWRAWFLQRVMGLVYSTKAAGKEASFGMRNTTSLRLVRLSSK